MSYVKFTDLIPGATYELKIFAIYNETSSHEVTATATLFPLAPTNLVSTGRTSTTISVKWNKAIGRADSYPIEWTPIDGEISIIDETATLSDLIPGVTYDIKVYAKSQNNIRRSEESAQVSIETEEALPGSPIFQSITTVDPTSVDIFWLKTPHPNGKILQHTIRYKQVYPHSHEEYAYKNFTATAESGRLESLDPGAWYVVHIRAQNSKGPGDWTNGEFIKNLPSLPGPVYNLTATAEKSRSLTITWETPEQPNGYIMQYELTVKDNMDNEIASVIFDRNLSGNPFECFKGQQPIPINSFLQTLPTINDRLITGEKTFEANCPVSYMLEDLEAYSSYRIYVEAFTSIGKGISETTTGRTLEEAPSGPPQNIVVKNVGPTYLTLEWNPPDFPNGELTYSVSYFDRSGLVLRTTTNLSYYTMEDLRPYAVYAIHLIANTKAGSSEWTDFLLLNTTQDVPNKPVELSGKVMNSKSVYLSWYPPSGTRGIVTSYQVVIYDIDKQKSLRTDIVYSNARNITEQPSLSLNTGENENLPHSSVVPEVIAKIQELESKITIGVNETINYLVQHLNPYTLYEFRISAVTSAGPGNYSATQVKTAEDKPGSKPTNLRYENISSTSVNLTWAEPESPNGAIVAYEVIYISEEKELRFEVFDTTYAILKNMKKYSLYSVFVNSRTSAGRGPPSEELEMLTDEDVPGSPPFNLRYVNVTPTVAEVEWDPPLIPNGVIQFYTVYYKNETKEYSRKSNSTVIYLDDLRVYGEYWVQISASTRYGDGGLRSEPLYVHTGEGEPGSPPHELAYKNMTSSSVILSWEKPLEPNGIIQYYVIKILHDSSEEYLRLQTEGADTEFVVENLKPDSSYTVLVHAHTKHGDGGVESDPLQIHTKEDAPGSPPKSLSYKNLSSTSVELSWNEPATPNGQIENYIIYYNDKILTVTASGSSVKINVDDLEPYTTYEFNVSASTKAGEGPTTSITVYTDEDSPTSAPRDVTYVQLSSTAITLSWKPPRKPNGIVTEYLVEYSIEDNVFDSVTYETNVTLSDLQKYATYLATVTAFTRVGQGPSSSPVIFQTLEDAPSDPPRNVTAISEESTSMFVSWEPPMQPNGIIQFYTVLIGDGENIHKKKVINATSTVVENLKIYTWYNVYVTASTALGDGGKKSDVIRSRTKEGGFYRYRFRRDVHRIPDTSVNNLEALPVNSTSASISWSPPDRVTGILSYVVAVYKKNADDSPIFYTVIPDNKVFIDYLEPYTNYMVSVTPVVENVNETGPIAEVQFRTLEDRPWLPVADLNAVNITSTSAVLTWKATEKPNGVVIFHIIDVPKEKVNFEIPAETPEPTSRYEFTVKNLLPHTSYVAFVAPKTKVGTGPKESIQFTTSEGLPEDFATNVEIDTITSNEASITWKPPSKPNGRIVTYKIVYYELADDNKVDHETEKFVILPTPETHYTLENLRAFTTYKLIIFSANSAGIGPIHSLPEFFTTLEDVPAAPILECNPLNQNNIILTWEPPNNPNGNILSYKINYYLEAKPSDKMNNVTNGDEDSYIATGLLPFSYYIFELQAETKPGIGEPASCRVRTGEGFADPPKAIHTTNKTSTSLSVNWMEPDQFNGQLLHYAVLYRPPHYCWKNLGSVVTVSDREVCNLKSAETTKTIFYLENYSIYTVSVAAVTGAGLGKVGLERTFKTLVGAPSYPPRNVKGHAISSTAINVTWTEPLVLAGPTTYQIVVKLGEKTIKESDEYPSEISEVTVADLDKDTRYAVSVSAITSAGKLSSGNTMIRTDEDAPSDPPVLLRVNTTDGNTSTVLVEFLPPGDPNGAIYEYNLQYKSEKANHNMTIHILDADLPYTGEPVTNTSPHWMIVTGLLGGRNYYFRMNSATQEGTGPWSDWSGPILLPVNSPPVPNVTLVITSFGEKNKASSSKLLVDICGVFSDENGPLENITIIVAEDEGKIDKDPTHWFEAYYMKPSPPYMVRATSNPVEFCSPDGQISKSTRKRRSIAEAPKFVLGNDQTCETTKKPYCNGPLKSNTPLKLRGTTTNGEYTETEFSDPVRTRSSFLEANMYLIVGLVVGIVVFVLFVIILVCVIRKRLTQQSLNESQRSDRSSGSLNKRATSSLPASPHNMSFVMEPTNVKRKKSITRPVSKAHFPNHVTRMSAHNDKGFASEFEEIESVTPFGPKTIGSQACNKSKNRFAEIIPYDHYRVKIENLGSTESSGYINASYIPGSSTPEQYIATQSPLGHTKNDLWRMIWETGAKRIIMLGNVDLEGNDHCTKYWPNTSQTTYYGNLSVQSLHEERQPEWTIRNFTISKRDKRRQLTQYHFTMWPVRGVPDNPQPLVRFLQTFRMGKPVGDSPTVVMCSTGSGRTAVFIALDIIMDTIDKEINIDPCGVVADLRNYRPYMIQTAAEYSFLHRCLAYVLTSVSSEKSSVRSPTGDGEETTMF
uniref:phosphatidylinositol phosphatase PTPRQ-like n=1 Tax=Styela clava TaxID=7725 RepID=UPI00193A5E58|nr:phosphatidylinositol phosphatase PTPRQ-like [Styela clava]